MSRFENKDTDSFRPSGLIGLEMCGGLSCAKPLLGQIRKPNVLRLQESGPPDTSTLPKSSSSSTSEFDNTVWSFCLGGCLGDVGLKNYAIRGLAFV